MKTMKTKTFDAVAESRRWKEAVSRETEGMTRDQVLALFNKDRVIAALGTTRQAEEPTCIVREEPPESLQS
jgi:hypothetical protein